MEWFIIGLVFGGVGLWFASWMRAKDIRIKWYAWIFIGLALLVLVLGVMDFRTFIKAMEPEMAVGALWLYGIPGFVLALIAMGLIWLENWKSNAPIEGE